MAHVLQWLLRRQSYLQRIASRPAPVSLSEFQVPLLKMLLTYDNCVSSSCFMYFLHSSFPRSYCKTINCWELWGEVFWFVFGALSHRFYWSWFGHQIGLPVQLQPFKRCLDIIMTVTLHHITLACTWPQARWIQLINQVMLTCAFEVPILSFTGRFSHTRRMWVLSCILVYNRGVHWLCVCSFHLSLLFKYVYCRGRGWRGPYNNYQNFVSRVLGISSVHAQSVWMSLK